MIEVSVYIQKNETGYLVKSPEMGDRQIRGETLDSVLNEAKELIRVYLDNASQRPDASTGQALLGLFSEFVEDMTDEEVAQLPGDGATQHDHYIYGTPKQ